MIKLLRTKWNVREAKIYPGKDQKPKNGWKNVESSSFLLLLSGAKIFSLNFEIFLVEILMSKNLCRFQAVYVLCVSWLFKDSNFGSPITWWRGNAKRATVIGRRRSVAAAAAFVIVSVVVVPPGGAARGLKSSSAGPILVFFYVFGFSFFLLLCRGF